MANSISRAEIRRVYPQKVTHIHCLSENDKVCKIKCKKDQNYTSFPPHSFVQGAIYPLDIDSILDLGGAEFMIYMEKQIQ